MCIEDEQYWIISRLRPTLGQYEILIRIAENSKQDNKSVHEQEIRIMLKKLHGGEI